MRINRDRLRAGALRATAVAGSRVGAVALAERRNRSRGGIVLALHEISAGALARALEQVASSYALVPLDELVRRIADGRSTAGLAVVTFDDGVAEVVESGAALARDRGWPMTFYLPTRAVDSGEPYWFHALEAILDRPDWTEARLSDPPLTLRRAPGDPGVRELSRLLQEAPDVERVAHLVAQLRASLGVRPGSDGPAPVAWSRVRELAAREELSFEAHGVNHLAVSRLPEDEIRRELAGSRDRIQEVTGRPVRHFCYPYGGPDDIGPLAPRVAAELFASAVTMSRGRCGAGASPHLLPRIPIYEQDSEEMIALKIALAR